MAEEIRAFLLKTLEPRSELFLLVMGRIAEAKRRAARVRFGVLGVCSLLLGGASISALGYAVNEFHTSGFYEYVLLLSAGFRQGYGKDVLYSLIDSLPSLAILLLGTLGVALVFSLRRVVCDARTAFSSGIMIA